MNCVWYFGNSAALMSCQTGELHNKCRVIPKLIPTCWRSRNNKAKKLLIWAHLRYILTTFYCFQPIKEHLTRWNVRIVFFEKEVEHRNFLWTGRLTKGQLFSEWIYDDKTSPKKRTKNCKDFCPHSQGRNPCNFSFIFWEKFYLHKFILKLTDL